MSIRRQPRLLIQWPRFRAHQYSRLAACRRLLTDDIEVVGFATSATGRDTLADASSHPPIHSIFDGMPYSELSRNALLSKIWGDLDRLRPDAVAVNGYRSDDSLACLLWCRQNKTPAILMSDEWESAYERRPKHNWMNAIVVRQFSAALVAGSHQRAHIESLGIPAKDIFEGYHAIDNEHFESGAYEARHGEALPSYRDLPDRFFLATGKFVGRKNFLTLLEAYSEYREEIGRHAKDLVLMGDGPLKKTLCERAQAHDLAGHVHFIGEPTYDQLPYIYGLADVFVCPSRYEPWGIAIQEAMASGLPVAVSDQCGAAADLVRDGVNGITFDPMHIDNISAALMEISKAAFRYKEMGLASREIAESYSLTNFAFAMRLAFDAARESTPSISRSLLGKLFAEFSIIRPLSEENPA